MGSTLSAVAATTLFLTVGLFLAGSPSGAQELKPFDKDTGYRGIWYFNQEINTEYRYKYSGGLGTYCANHLPFAIYAPAVNKTFFVYGGTKPCESRLIEMVSYYDHATGMVPRPTFLMDKGTDDAHDNPVISLDDSGHVWVFASSHGKSRPSYIFRSKQPYNVDDFDVILETNFSYPQPWCVPGKGFLFLHTTYEGGRVLCWQTSPDGVTWSDRSKLAAIDQGHYQVSWPCGTKVGTAFNYHPNAFQGDPSRKGLNWRTNIYYVETDDMGKTWRDVSGQSLSVPLTERQNPALAVEYESQGLLAYLQDLNFDKRGGPVILHTVARHWEPGPEHGIREWRVAHWTGREWALRAIAASDNNYDTGCLHIEEDGTWRIIGPTETGPQAHNPGGEMAVWVSKDEGKTWNKVRDVTRSSVFNHTYARRPVNAHPDFYAYWADGHGRRPSESRLYFCDKTGRKVYRLPYTMDKETEKPPQIR